MMKRDWLAVARAGLLVALLTLITSGEAGAIGFSWGDVVVNRLGNYGFTNTNSVLSFDGGTTDQLYTMYGYLGNANGVVVVDNSSFNVLTAISAVDNVATSSVTLDANGAAALGLNSGDIQIDYTFTLVDDPSPADRDAFLWDLTLTNNSASDLDLTFYSYLDLDLGGAGDYTDDEAIADASEIFVFDQNDALEFSWVPSGGSADHFEVGDYPTVLNKLAGMTSATDLADGPGTFGPADFSAAFQYDFLAAAGGSVTLSPGAVVPEPDPATLAMLGLAMLGLFRWGERSSASRP